MSRQIDKFNYRVEVTPLVTRWDRETNKVTDEQRCNQVAKFIERRVDNVASVVVVHDEAARCSHCKNRWDENAVIPECCPQAQEDYRVLDV